MNTDLRITTRRVTRALALAAVLAVPASMIPATAADAQIGVGISIGIAPPPLPVYAQPEIPGDGYVWTPGYWAYGDAGYYWVPGTWVLPPRVGVLWTPAYWGWEGGHYRFYNGYWGPHVGFYGGINYGFGYGGVGFEGGYWNGPHFFYNTAVVRFGGGFHPVNVYNRTVVNNINVTRVSFNGGNGGVNYHANAQEQAAFHEQHVQPTSMQTQHQSFAAQNPQQRFSANGGHPAVTAASSPAAFHANPTNQAAASHVTGREANQDQRIANGLRSGQMTSGEAAKADARQSAIDQQVHNDRTANGGALTQQQKQQVNREQNGASRQIYNQNHNGNTIAPNAADTREANQQQRTAQGLRTGQTSSGEAARTNANQAGVDQQVHNDRTANGGALNQQQRQQVNQQQNRDSRQIDNQKHNAAQGPKAAPQPHEAPREAPKEDKGGKPRGR